MIQKNSLKAFFACGKLIRRTKSIKLIMQNVALRTSASNLMPKKVRLLNLLLNETNIKMPLQRWL